MWEKTGGCHKDKEKLKIVLTKSGYHGTISKVHQQAAIAQSVVRNIGSVEVTGSIPVSSSGMIDSFQKKRA